MASRLVLIGCLGLTGLAVAPVAHASFPGRNGGIAFAQRIASGDSDPQFVERFRLVTAPPGSEVRRVLLECVLTDGVPSGGDCSGTGYGSPSYSPDGRMLVFDAGQRIGVIDADGGGRVALFPAASADDGSPAFAPDSNRIVFSGSNDRGTTDIYVRRMNGGAPRLIVNDAGEPVMVLAQPSGLRAQRQHLQRSPGRQAAPLRDLWRVARLVAGRQASAVRAAVAEARVRRAIRTDVCLECRRRGPASRACEERRLLAGLVTGRPFNRLRALRPGRVRQAPRKPAPGPAGGADPGQRGERVRHGFRSGLAAAAAEVSLANDRQRGYCAGDVAAERRQDPRLHSRLQPA